MKEHKYRQNHSSDLFTFTRVISNKKEARRTVGLTINPRLLEEARNRNLNLSRIFEQALQSILEYIPQEKQTESSEFLSPGSFLKKEAGPTGIEPAAYGLRVRRSNLTELRAR
jgi:post-segregation antitoxin (ccd killing protein)